MARKKKLKLSKHANHRMRQRKVKRTHLDKTVHNPDRIYAKSKDLHYHERRCRTGKNPILRVILDPIRMLVITLFYTKKFTEDDS